MQESLPKFSIVKKLPLKDFTKEQQHKLLFALPTYLLTEEKEDSISTEHVCKWIDLLTDMGFDIGNAKTLLYGSILMSVMHTKATEAGEMIISLDDQTTLMQKLIDKGVDIKSDKIIEEAIKYCDIPVILNQILNPTILGSMSNKKERLMTAKSYNNLAAIELLSKS